MIIDCHTHVGRDIFTERNVRFQKFITPYKQSTEELLLKMNTLQIDKAIVYSFPSPLCQFEEDDFWYHKENRYLIEELEDYKEKLYFVPAFNPKDEESMKYAVELAEKNKLRGLKLHTRATQYKPEHLNPLIVRVLQKEGIPLVLHIGTGKELELAEKGIDISLDSAISLAKSHPNINFVFAHLGRLHKNLYRALELENVMIDTAGISLTRTQKDFVLAKFYDPILSDKPIEEIISYLIAQGYQDKIIWGSDEPYGVSYEEELHYVANNAYINKEVKEKLLYKNAIKWFKLAI
jgi:predicted TIM-barrel fold metal-dependent hydrolase